MGDGSVPLDAPAPAPDAEGPRPARYINLREFMDLGYLQELNRLFLHPLGLAIALNVDEKHPERVTFAGVRDDRDDPEGVRFEFSTWPDDLRPAAISRFKSNVAHVERQWEDRRAAREKALGYMVQPTTDPVLG